MELLTRSWISELSNYKKIIVGFSGGLDSCVLLHLLASNPTLHGKLFAVHVNHGLSSNAQLWQEHCQDFCANLNVPIQLTKVNLINSSSIEEQARRARYKVFVDLLTDTDCLVLAHHQNDQAETVLFNIVRGSGVSGLGGIPKQRKLGAGRLLRPLMDYKRENLSRYAYAHNLTWVTDESNSDVTFSRNYLRQKILPEISEKWPHATSNIAKCAEKCVEALDNLRDLALIDCPSLYANKQQLDLDSLIGLNDRRIINVLRVWFEYNRVISPSAHAYLQIIQEVIKARSDKSPKFCFADIALRRFKNKLYILQAEQLELTDIPWKNFPNPLYLQDGRVIHAKVADYGVTVSNPDSLWVRFRKGGETIRYKGQTKKLKKLFQELDILPWERDLLPLLYVEQQLQAVLGLLVTDNSFTEDTKAKYIFTIESMGE